MPGEGEGGGGGTGSGGGSGTGGGGGPDVGAIIAYLNHQSFGVNGDFTGNGGYGGDNTGPMGFKEPEQSENNAIALLDAIPSLTGQTFAPPSRRAGPRDVWREIEPYTGARLYEGSLFAFVGHDVDPYSGMALGSESPDPFSGTQVRDPFTPSGPPARAGKAASFAAIRRHNSLLISPNLIAANGPIACGSALASCAPELRSDASYNRSSVANMTEAEMESLLEPNVAATPSTVEGKAQITGSSGFNVQGSIAAAVRVMQSPEYQLAVQVNQLRNHPLQVWRSALSLGLGHMFWGGVTTLGSAAILYGTGGGAWPLIGSMGLATGITQFSSGLVLAINGGDRMEAVRMSGQLDQAFALTSSPASLVFGTTGVVWSGGRADVMERTALFGGIVETGLTLRFDRSKLYAAVLPEAKTTADKAATILLVKDVATLGTPALVKTETTVSGMAPLWKPHRGEEVFVGEWLNRNLQNQQNLNVAEFLSDPSKMAQLVPPSVPFIAIPQYGGYVIEYGLKARVEAYPVLSNIVGHVPLSGQLRPGGGPDLVLQQPFAQWGLHSWDSTSALAAIRKANAGKDYTFLTYTLDWRQVASALASH